MLKRLDRSVLTAWVVACVFHQEAAEAVKKTGQVVKSPSGYPIVNPYMGNMNKQAQIMLKAAEQLGFSPAARPRVHVDQEAEKSNPFEAFGSAARAKASAEIGKTGPKVH